MSPKQCCYLRQGFDLSTVSANRWVFLKYCKTVDRFQKNPQIGELANNKQQIPRGSLYAFFFFSGQLTQPIWSYLSRCSNVTPKWSPCGSFGPFVDKLTHICACNGHAQTPGAQCSTRWDHLPPSATSLTDMLWKSRPEITVVWIQT